MRRFSLREPLNSPTDPDSETVVFTATLSAANEVPPVTGAEANATGSITITMEVTRDSSDNITEAQADFNGAGIPRRWRGTIIIAHIYRGAAGAEGDIEVDSGLTAGAAIPIANGSATLTFGDRTVEPEDAEDILDNPAGFYFNVHSALNTGGVVRGQLVREGS